MAILVGPELHPVAGRGLGGREVGGGVGVGGGGSGWGRVAEGRRAIRLRDADVWSPKSGRALRFSLAFGSPSPLLGARKGGAK